LQSKAGYSASTGDILYLKLVLKGISSMYFGSRRNYLFGYILDCI